MGVFIGLLLLRRFNKVFFEDFNGEGGCVLVKLSRFIRLLVVLGCFLILLVCLICLLVWGFEVIVVVVVCWLLMFILYLVVYVVLFKIGIFFISVDLRYDIDRSCE